MKLSPPTPAAPARTGAASKSQQLSPLVMEFHREKISDKITKQQNLLQNHQQNLQITQLLQQNHPNIAKRLQQPELTGEKNSFTSLVVIGRSSSLGDDVLTPVIRTRKTNHDEVSQEIRSLGSEFQGLRYS